MRAVLSALALWLCLWPGPSAIAQGLIYPDGRAMPLDQVPLLRKHPSLIKILDGLGTHTEVVVAMPPPLCPSFYYYWHAARALSLAPTDRQEAVRRCNGMLAQRIKDFPKAAQASCKCEIAIEGRAGSKMYLKADVSAAADPLLYGAAKLVERRQGQVQEALGVVGASEEAGVLRLYNQSMELMCSGALQATSNEVSLDCSRIGTQATGRYRIVKDSGVPGGTYGLARINLPGATLDVAAGISDADLKRRHPSFPDWQ